MDLLWLMAPEKEFIMIQEIWQPKAEREHINPQTQTREGKLEME